MVAFHFLYGMINYASYLLKIHIALIMSSTL